MKYTKIYLFTVFALVSCTTSTPIPETATPTRTPKGGGAPTNTVTPDPLVGSIEGNLSWLLSSTSTSLPIEGVNLEINEHTGDRHHYMTRADANGHFIFANIDPGDYGFGIYLNLQLDERKCETPEYVFGQDLGWQHYATWLKVDVWYDILFSSIDVKVKPGETAVLDFVLKCP